MTDDCEAVLRFRFGRLHGSGGNCRQAATASCGPPFFDIVLPCGGGIQLAIHVLRDSVAVRGALANLSLRRRVSLRYDPARQRLEADLRPLTSGWNGTVFVRAHRPKARLVLCGRGIELATTAAVAAAVGYETRILDSEQGTKPDPFSHRRRYGGGAPLS